MTQEFDGPRSACAGELDAILDLTNLVQRGGKGLPPTIARDYPFIYNEKNLENIVIIKDGDQVISTVAIWPNEIQMDSARLSIGGINCLATRPGYRGGGLATEVMLAAHNRMQQLGCVIGRLTTGITKWYRRLGWENAGSLCAYEVNHSNVGQLTPLPAQCHVQCFDAPFADYVVTAAVRLHNADRLGGIRTASLMKVLLMAGSDPKLSQAAQIAMVFEQDQPVAYLVDRGQRIVEWGGAAELVAGLIRSWFEMRAHRLIERAKMDREKKVEPSESIEIVGPREGHSFLDYLLELSTPRSQRYWGMLNLLDPQSILNAYGLNDITVQQNNGNFSLHRDTDSVTLTRQELTKHLFGPERVCDFATEVFPLNFWQWPLDHV